VTPLLEVRGAVKSYGAVRALDGVDLTVGPREVVALLGDNGAGKSTLIKAISGVHTLDAGELRIEGEPVTFASPREAQGAGIDTLHQDLGLFDNLSAVANFRIGRELRRPRFLGRLALLRERAMEDDWRTQLERLAVNRVDPRQEVGLMSGGQRQAIAVARAVAFATKVVLLDEPTAALGLRESQQVLDLVRSLPEHGVSVILISHNLEHVMDVAHRAVVLRRGRIVGEEIPTPETHERLVSLIVGGADAAAANGGGSGADAPAQVPPRGAGPTS
jgi:D-xylose transport system ATP-binding protein